MPPTLEAGHNKITIAKHYTRRCAYLIVCNDDLIIYTDNFLIED